MDDMLFYAGRGPDAVEAIRGALSLCAPIMEENPSLILELQEVTPHGTYWEAHVRVMAIKSVSGSSGRKPGGGPEDLEQVPKSPEHFRSGSPDDGRPVGMEHDNMGTYLESFDVAAHGGYIPDVPLQDLELAKEGWSEVEIRTHAASTDQHPAKHRLREPALNYE